MPDHSSSVKAQCQACGADFTAGDFSECTYPGSDKNDAAPASIIVCNQCGLGVASPMLSDAALKELYEGEGSNFWDFDSRSPVVSSRQYPVLYGLAKARYGLIQEHFSFAEKESCSILDVGAGFAFFGVVASQKLNRSRLQYIAVEPDESLKKPILNMWESLGLHSDIRVLPQIEDVDGKADILVISQVLEHISNPHIFLKKMLHYLKDDGLLFIDVPHQDQRFKADVFPHLFFYTPQSLKFVLEKQGLEVIDIDAWGCDWKDSPLSKNEKNKFFHLIDRFVGRIAPYLPVTVSSRYFSSRYGMAKRSPEGTWIRALVKTRC